MDNFLSPEWAMNVQDLFYYLTIEKCPGVELKIEAPVFTLQGAKVAIQANYKGMTVGALSNDLLTALRSIIATIEEFDEAENDHPTEGEFDDNISV